MERVCVTGASGFVGSNLVFRLRELGSDVVAFLRRSSATLALQGSDAARVYGDVLDPGSLRDAFRGCDTVFHTAGVVSFRRQELDRQSAVNVLGTRNVVDACLSAGVGKCVFTSSVATLGYRTDGLLIDETVPFNWKISNGYRFTKYRAEQEILEGVRRGLDATIVNPSIIIGARDLHAHGGSLLTALARFPLPAVPAGGINCVSVHDVVDGHISAAVKGGRGERYILGGTNLTHMEMFSLAARTVGTCPPVLEVPRWLVQGISAFSEFLSRSTGNKSFLPSDMVEGVDLLNWYSIEKARKDLGYAPHPVAEAMQEAYSWYRKAGIL